MSTPPVASVVVAYCSEEHLAACVAAAPGTVWVIDNSPSAPTPQAGQINFEAHPENLGFAGGVNRGFALTREPLVLVLNPDCVLQAGVDAMVAEFENPRVGAVGGLLLGEDGQPQAGFAVRRFPTSLSLALEILGLNRLLPGNAVNRRYRCLDLDLTRAQDVDQPAGAFLMIRRSAWEAVGGFDTRFHPVWFEDVDFCQRLVSSRLVPYWFNHFSRRCRYILGGHSVQKIDAWMSSQRMTTWYGSLLMVRCEAFFLSVAGRCLIALSPWPCAAGSPNPIRASSGQG